MHRAEEVVDRNAEQVLPAPERQRRVQQMRHELEERDECGHSGRFEKILAQGGARFLCEMCNFQAREFILRCRRCQLQVCAECHRHRIR
jgi:hypothetical protein